MTRRQRIMSVGLVGLVLAGTIAAALQTSAPLVAKTGGPAGAPGTPYADMPAFAPIGVRVDRYLDVPESAKGPAVDPAKGYRIQKLGDGRYMVTDGGGYQSMFMTYEDGVVVIDAPPSYADKIPKAIAEISSKPITHVVYPNRGR